MAWGTDGELRRERVKLALALCRIESYRLLQACRGVDHPEKGPDLVSKAEQFKQIEDDIERQLNR